MTETSDTAGRFAIYRTAEAPAFSEIDVMDYEGVTPQLESAFAKLNEAGVEAGQTVKLLFSAPGFSLTYAWFKSGFPLPRHSHDADLHWEMAAEVQLFLETLA